MTPTTPTPRTDALVEKTRARMTEKNGADVHDVVDFTILCRELERELAALSRPVVGELPEGEAQCLGDVIDQALAEQEQIGGLGPQTIEHLQSWRSRLSSPAPGTPEQVEAEPWGWMQDGKFNGPIAIPDAIRCASPDYAKAIYSTPLFTRPEPSPMKGGEIKDTQLSEAMRCADSLNWGDSLIGDAAKCLASYARLAEKSPNGEDGWNGLDAHTGTPLDRVDLEVLAQCCEKSPSRDIRGLVPPLARYALELRALRDETTPQEGTGHGYEVVNIPKSKNLDPITVYLKDHGPGRGEITITCFGESWTNFWGAMGKETIRQFFATAETDYLMKKLGAPLDPGTAKDAKEYGVTDPRELERIEEKWERWKSKNEYITRIVEAVRAALAPVNRKGEA